MTQKPLISEMRDSIFSDSNLKHITLRSITNDDVQSTYEINENESKHIVQSDLVKPLRKALKPMVGNGIKDAIYWNDYLKLVQVINECYNNELIELLTCLVVTECREDRNYVKAQERIIDIDAEIKHLKKQKVVQEQYLYDYESNYLLDLYEERKWIIFGDKIPENIVKEIKFRFKRNATKRNEVEYEYAREEV